MCLDMLIGSHLFNAVSKEAEEDEDDGKYGTKEDPKDALKATQAAFKGRGATDRMKKSLNKQFIPQGVEIVDVMITKVYNHDFRLHRRLVSL